MKESLKNNVFGLIILAGLMFSPVCFGEILFIKGGGVLKGKVIEKSKEQVKVKIAYGEITLSRSEVNKICEDTDPDAIYELAIYYISREEWDSAVEEFDNLLLVKPEMKNKVLNYLSDLNFSKSSKDRLKSLDSVAKANQMIEEGKILVNLGEKQLKYNTQFNDPEWQKKVRSIAQANIKRGEDLIKRGQAIIDSYHSEREAEIRRAREKAEQEKNK